MNNQKGIKRSTQVLEVDPFIPSIYKDDGNPKTENKRGRKKGRKNRHKVKIEKIVKIYFLYF